MKAVILAGGEGARLRPYTFVVPKPLLPVRRKPVLQIIVEHLRSHDVREIILATGYLGELIEAYFGTGERYEVRISYVREAKPLGTAAPLTLLGDRLAVGEDFILMNGDILTKLDFRRLVEHHRRRKSALTIGVKRLEEQSPYGVLRLEGEALVGIEEKPRRTSDVNAGIYVVNERVVGEIPRDTYYTMPDLVNARLRAGRPVHVFHIEEPWLALEQAEHLEEANRAPDRWTAIPCE